MGMMEKKMETAIIVYWGIYIYRVKRLTGFAGFIRFVGFIRFIGFIEFIGFIGFMGFMGFIGFRD